MAQGKRTREQRIRSLLAQAKTKATEKYTVGGLLKRQYNKPKPISLVKISLPKDKDDDVS